MTRPFVLIVEDSIPDAELAQLAVTELDLDLEVELAHNANEAMSQLERLESREHPPHPVLIWLDLRLPEVDGFAVLKRLRMSRTREELPVVVFSSSIEEGQVRAALLAGANAYVHKPDDVEIYLRRVGQITHALLSHTVWPSPIM